MDFEPTEDHLDPHSILEAKQTTKTCTIADVPGRISKSLHSKPLQSKSLHSCRDFDRSVGISIGLVGILIGLVGILIGCVGILNGSVGIVTASVPHSWL